jgi:hypothetical protein
MALVATLILCGVSPRLCAQQGPVQNPLTTEQHLRLAFLVSQWEEEITYTNAQGEQVKGTGRWVARPALGLYLQIQYEGSSPAGPYRAFGVLTYDREEQVYRMWWFDDAAGIGEYRGSFADESSLVLEHNGKVEGKAFRERIRYTRVSPTELRTKIEQAWEGGEFKPFLEGVAHRTGEGPGRGPGQRSPQSNPPGNGGTP